MFQKGPNLKREIRARVIVLANIWGREKSPRVFFRSISTHATPYVLRMLSKLTCRQGARPALVSLPKRKGVSRPQALVSAPHNGPQFCSTLSVLASPLTPTPCRSQKPEKHEAGVEACCKRFVIKEVKMSGFLGGGGSRDSARKVWIKSIKTPERIEGIIVVGQRFSARWYGSTLAPSVGRGSTRQQRQRCPYSSKSGFGGGQHFPNSNNEQVTTMSRVVSFLSSGF